MSDTRKVSIVIPTYNRFQFTVDSFSKILNDDRVHGVYITDDCSTDDSYQKLTDFFSDNEKVHLFRNEKNIDCYFNKHKAMENAEGEWCILFDSDNVIGIDYLDAIFAIQEWMDNVVYQPHYARPHFDFRPHSGLYLTKKNISTYIYTNLETALNAMNFFINRAEYLRIWDGSIDPITSDSIFFNYCWLKSGNHILITPGLEYDHLCHEGHYFHNYKKAIGFHNFLLKEISILR